MELKTEHDFYVELKKSEWTKHMSDKEVKGFAHVEYERYLREWYEKECKPSDVSIEEIDAFIAYFAKTGFVVFIPKDLNEVAHRMNTMERYLAESIAGIKEFEIEPSKVDKMGIVESSVRFINHILHDGAKNDFKHLHPYLVQLAKEYARKYNLHQNAGRKSDIDIENGIQMVDVETNESVDRFETRNDIIDCLGISKGNLSKCLKSVHDNPDDRSKWKTFKVDGKKFFFVPY